ncbi:MAG: TRAP transporter large permease [Alphaproteobacteria bacterium]|nr:TRAP transporter large permease [Alphaproteobacteria bacterium]
MLAAMFLRVPIGLAMFIAGGFGMVVLRSWSALVGSLKSVAYDVFATDSLAVIPIFLLMGHFAAQAGMSAALFRLAQALLGHRRGGLAIATIGACAGFGAICGSSIATAATMGQVALPEMRRAGYAGSLSTGTLAAGGTLGILIPPSIVLVIYAILAEQNIAKLFVAAFLPGVLAALGYMTAIALVVRRTPGLAPTTPRATGRELRRAILAVWPVLAIFALVIGGMYGGLFTPTEGAAVGAFGTALLALRAGMRLGGFLECLRRTAVATAMIFFIVLGAQLFNSFMAFTQIPQIAADAIAGSGLNAWVVLALILLAYLVLGCLMDSLSMILLTIPIFFPAIMKLDFGLPPEQVAIWFGILALIVVEVGLITPPVGMNLFVINAMARDVPMLDTYRGVLPFVVTDILRTIVLVVFPGITLIALRLLE